MEKDSSCASNQPTNQPHEKRVGVVVPNSLAGLQRTDLFFSYCIPIMEEEGARILCQPLSYLLFACMNRYVDWKPEIETACNRPFECYTPDMPSVFVLVVVRV